MMKIAIQGELGAFSHEAALRMVPRCTGRLLAVGGSVRSRGTRIGGGRGDSD